MVLAVEALKNQLLRFAGMGDEKLTPAACKEHTESNLQIVRNLGKTLQCMEVSTTRSADYARIMAKQPLTPSCSHVNVRRAVQVRVDLPGYAVRPSHVQARLISVQRAIELATWHTADAPHGAGPSDTVALEAIPDDVPEVLTTDGQWFRHNLLCILSNAIKYSDDVRTPVRIRLQRRPALHAPDREEQRMELRCDRLEVSVTDSGLELTSDERERLFSAPIQRLRDGVGGMGVGLVTLAARVNACGGDYGCRPRGDGLPGLVVWFALPIDHPQASPATGMSRATSVRAKIRVFGSSKVAPQAAQQGSAWSVGSDDVLGRLASPIRIPPRVSMKLRGARNVGMTTSTKRGSSAKPSSGGSHARDSSPRDCGDGTSIVALPDLSKHSADELAMVEAEAAAAAALKQRAEELVAPARGDVDRDVVDSANDSDVVDSAGADDDGDGADDANDVDNGVDMTGWRVLIVDDSMSILKLLSFVLSREGCVVTQAKNGLEAVHACSTTLFDFVLMDFQMPLMSGPDAVAQIRKTERERKSPNQIILGMSAQSDGDTAAEARLKGFDSFLPKAFTVRDVRRRLAAVKLVVIDIK